VYGYREYKVELTNHAYNRYRERGGYRNRKKLLNKVVNLVNDTIRSTGGLKFSRNGTALLHLGGGYIAAMRIECGVLSVRTIILRGGKREVERVVC